MENEDILYLLQKLSDENITSEEEKYLFQWLEAHQDEWMMELFDSYRLQVSQRLNLLDQYKSKEILVGIHNKLGLSVNSYVDKDPIGKEVRINWAFFSGIAASIAILIMLTGWFLVGSEQKSEINNIESRVQNESDLYLHKNVSESIELIGLSDGSAVWLYPESILEYPKEFSGSDRKVKLIGKAFFEVVKNDSSPFWVISSEMFTKVLGTSFMVNAFENQSKFEVNVKTGSVAVKANYDHTDNSKSETVALSANESVVLDRTKSQFTVQAKQTIIQEEFPVNNVIEQYVFRDTPVDEILSVLESDYQVEIRVEGEPLELCSLNTTLAEKSLLEKLKLICAGIGPSTYYTLNEKEIVIFSAGCNR